MVLSWSRRGLDWISGNFFFTETVVKHWHRLPRAGVEHQPWKRSKNVWMLHLGTWASGECGGAGLMVGLDELKNILQP